MISCAPMMPRPKLTHVLRIELNSPWAKRKRHETVDRQAPFIWWSRPRRYPGLGRCSIATSRLLPLRRVSGGAAVWWQGIGKCGFELGAAQSVDRAGHGIVERDTDFIIRGVGVA